MSIATAKLTYIFGLNTRVSGNVFFCDDQIVVYPAGANCVLYNMENKSQKFIPATDKYEGITALASSPNHRYLAIAEKAERPTISIYDLHSLRKKKVLSTSEVVSEEYVSMAFSPDSKFFLTQGGKPDWTLLYWSWEKGKVLAASRAVNLQNPLSQVYQVSFSPKDNRQMCVVGNTIFRCMRYSEGSMKSFGYQKMESLNYLCHDWLSDEKILVGTACATIMILEAGEVKQEIRLAPKQSIVEDTCLDTALHVTALVTLSNGFLCAFGLGTVYHYEKVDDIFKIKRSIVIPFDNCNSVDITLAKDQVICCLARNLSEDMLIASTKSAQLYTITLSAIDTGKQASQINFEVMSHMFHNAPITGIDVCVRKPLAVTCAMDCSVKIWNYETFSLEVYKVFAEEALSIALHPSGLFILVGFSDKMRLMNLFIDDIRPFREFPVRGCRECAFSQGGHLFASVMGNVIQLYSTYTFKNINNLKGHNGKVKAVVWSSDDSKLVSCGMDGAVYEWEPFTGKRIGESVLKSCIYSSITVAADGKSVIAAGSDNLMKEIAESRILREVETGDIVLTSVVLSHSGRMLFAGTTKGTVLTVKYPLTITGDWIEYQGHSSAIVKIKIGYDDHCMVSIAEDGTVLLWKLFDKEGHDVKRDVDFSWADEILIIKKDLDEKNLAISELNARMYEVETESKYQIQQKDLAFNEKMTQLTQTFINEMERLKTKNQVMKTEKDQEVEKHDEAMEELISAHALQLDNIETANNNKLVDNFEKFQEHQSKFVQMQEEYEKQLLELDNSKEKALEALTEYYEKKLQEVNVKLAQSQFEGKQQTREYLEEVKQIEEDCDREILDIRHFYEKKLRDEKDSNTKLKGENCILKKRFNTLYKEIEDLKDEIKKLKTETNKITNISSGLENDISILKQDLFQRDINIEFKEAEIFKLKRKNQELEKFRFVLNYKIKELREQIEPREIDIKKMKEQIQEMELELGKFHKQNIQVEQTLTEFKQKLKATDKEMHHERQKVHDVSAIVRRFKIELHNCVGNIQDQRLFREGIRALYQRHVLDDITETASVDADIQKEFTRQKEHLERSLASLRKKLVKDSEVHRTDIVKIMQENVALIKEISDLRKELKLCRDLIHDMTAAITIESHQKKNKPASLATHKPVPPLVEREMQEQKKVIEMQQMELKRMRFEIYDLERALRLSRSATRIPSLST